MVCDDVERALEMVGAGAGVVLIVAPGHPPPVIPRGSPGRLAFFVGEADDPAVIGAAEDMDAELFGARAGDGPTIRG